MKKDVQVGNDFCIGFAQGYSYNSAGGLVVPVGSCAPVIKPTLQCEIKGDTTIDHGKISDSYIDGNEALAIIQLTCTGASKVLLYTKQENRSGVKLRPDGSLHSKLTIDGKNTADGIYINITEGAPIPVSIKSTLFSTGGIEPGGFSGSTVLVITSP